MTDRQFEPRLLEACARTMEPYIWSDECRESSVTPKLDEINRQSSLERAALCLTAYALWQEEHGEPSAQWARDLYEIILRDYEAIPTSGEVVTADIRPAFNGLCDYLAHSEPSPAYVAGLEKAKDRVIAAAEALRAEWKRYPQREPNVTFNLECALGKAIDALPEPHSTPR